MSGAPRMNLYEHPVLTSVTGGILRPGGMALTRRVVSSCGLPSGAKIVDVGCGTGATVDCLRREFQLRAYGVDPARRFGSPMESGLPLVQADAIQLPLRNGCMSAVICECVLSLLKDPDAALREFYRVLVGRGLVVLADIYIRAADHAQSLNAMPVASCLKGAVTRDAVEARLHRNGFVLLSWEDHSRQLKRMAAELVFACGSMKAFWETADGWRCGPADLTRVLQARPGYFIGVARKEGTPC
jgi:arsenite methyltransferase